MSFVHTHRNFSSCFLLSLSSSFTRTEYRKKIRDPPVINLIVLLFSYTLRHYCQAFFLFLFFFPPCQRCMYDLPPGRFVGGNCHMTMTIWQYFFYALGYFSRERKRGRESTFRAFPTRSIDVDVWIRSVDTFLWFSCRCYNVGGGSTEREKERRLHVNYSTLLIRLRGGEGYQNFN